MVHKAHPFNPNVSSELKTVPTVAIKCLLCLLITGSKVILDEFYQAKLQQSAASFPSSSCTSMLKSLSVIQKVCPTPGCRCIKIQIKRKHTQLFSIFLPSSMAEGKLPLCFLIPLSFRFQENGFHVSCFTEAITEQQNPNTSIKPSSSLPNRTLWNDLT